MSERRYQAHPHSAPGDFYVVNNECLSCGMPHVLAANLVGWVDAETSHCFWKRQPETQEEVQQAIDVVLNSEVACHRYAGDDPVVMSQIGWECCDSPLRALPEDFVPRRSPVPPSFALIESPRPIILRMINALREVFRI
jgi:hypothetical protein